jgi:hypothetical protein
MNIPILLKVIFNLMTAIVHLEIHMSSPSHLFNIPNHYGFLCRIVPTAVTIPSVIGRTWLY